MESNIADPTPGNCASCGGLILTSGDEPKCVNCGRSPQPAPEWEGVALRNCADCEADINYLHKNNVRCGDCAEKHRRSQVSEYNATSPTTSPAFRQCRDCEADISDRHHRALRCFDCVNKRNLESTKAAQDRRKTPETPSTPEEPEEPEEQEDETPPSTGLIDMDFFRAEQSKTRHRLREVKVYLKEWQDLQEILETYQSSLEAITDLSLKLIMNEVANIIMEEEGEEE